LAGKLKHADSILESFECFCQMWSKLILIILTYTVSKFACFFRHSVYMCEVWYCCVYRSSVWISSVIKSFHDYKRSDRPIQSSCTTETVSFTYLFYSHTQLYARAFNRL